jgi:hypothetical protein
MGATTRSKTFDPMIFAIKELENPMWTPCETATLRRLVAVIRACSCAWFAGLVLIGCTPNEAYRTAEPVACAERCDASPDTVIEQHEGYDLAFVEFTERGNVFDRNRMQQVVDYVAERARYDPSDPDRGVVTIVFVHGWKHNARADDGNVASFRKLLHKATVLSEGGPRKVIGVYVGWRGLSIDLGPITNVSYWDRKATAEQVAKGGVTELLLRLEREVIDDARPNRNLYLVTGHSFGGAVVLSALNEIFLERVVSAVAKTPEDACVESRPFGHGVVLLNPAIEANEVLQLKELVAETCFVLTQPRLMHVISSDADRATNTVFGLGQWFGVNLTWRQARLDREFDGRQVHFEESDLDTITVGNFIPFQTGQLERSDNAETEWHYRSCIGQEAACIDEAYRDRHIPVEHNEPLAFIHTDENFIADHNDVFNDNVSGYLAAIIAEARYKTALRHGLAQDERLPPDCRVDDSEEDFPFGACFALYQELFENISSES